jgi:glycosyltransferase involved in cell wall biosynthesis
LILASSLADKRKGVEYSLEIIRAISDLKPFVVLIGKEDKQIEKKLEGISFYITGYVSDEKKLNEYYNAADIFLNCTLADNQPLVVLETMAAGLPTVGFKTGGVPEMIDQNKTGSLVEQKNMSQLERVLRESINSKIYIQWGKNARNRVEENYTNEMFLKNHLDYYNLLLENRNKDD